MLSDIFHLDRRLALANERLRGTFPACPEIAETIDALLTAYARHHQLDATGILRAHETFARLFAQHLEQFRQGGQYPGAGAASMDRISYDISLLISCVVNTARFRIVEKLFRSLQDNSGAQILVIGCGAGIELELLRRAGQHRSVLAYDTDISPFVRQRFTDVDLRQQAFDASPLTHPVDTVLAIEILEHVEEPLLLMQHIHAALKPGGICLCTTATDLPQFDHRYNFTDIPQFQRQLQTLGFQIRETETFIQPYPFQGMESRNDWFTLQKTQESLRSTSA